MNQQEAFDKIRLIDGNEAPIEIERWLDESEEGFLITSTVHSVTLEDMIAEFGQYSIYFTGQRYGKAGLVLHFNRN